MTARIDVKANRKEDKLEVKAWWLEPGVSMSEGRLKKLKSELRQLAMLAGVSDVGNLPAPRKNTYF